MAAQSKTGLVGQVWKAVRQLNPETVKKEARRPLSLCVVGTNVEIDSIVAWLEQGQRSDEATKAIHRLNIADIPETGRPARGCNLVICASNCSDITLGIQPYQLFQWNEANPEQTINDILDEDRLTDLRFALASRFTAFRKSLNSRIIKQTSLENGAFVASTAIGSVIPNPLEPLTAIAEAAGDTVVLTANQVRMLFQLAAANGRPAGYMALYPQIGSIIAAAFGWRAIARELAGKIPFGGGLVAKATIAYAGTWVVGEGIIFYFTTGRQMTREEVRRRFQEVIIDARSAARDIVERIRQRVQARS